MGRATAIASIVLSAATVTAAGLLAVSLTPPVSEAMAHDAHVFIRTAALSHQLEGPLPLPTRPLPPAKLRLRNTVHREVLELVPFDPQGRPNPTSFERISHFFRSSKGSTKPIDPRLVEQLMMIGRHYAGHEMQLISGHRDPGHGTSEKSYHVRGMAADISIAGVRSRDLYKTAKKLGVRGTGYYPRFVHVDVRTVPYRWSGR